MISLSNTVCSGSFLSQWCQNPVGHVRPAAHTANSAAQTDDDQGCSELPPDASLNSEHSAYAATYLDDIIIHSATGAEHVQRVDSVLESLRKVGLSRRSVWLDGGRYSIWGTSCQVGRCALRQGKRMVKGRWIGSAWWCVVCGSAAEEGRCSGLREAGMAAEPNVLIIHSLFQWHRDHEKCIYVFQAASQMWHLESCKEWIRTIVNTWFHSATLCSGFPITNNFMTFASIIWHFITDFWLLLRLFHFCAENKTKDQKKTQTKMPCFQLNICSSI